MPRQALRWFVLIAVVLNVSFSNLYELFSASETSIAARSARYDNFFTPAGYVFSIWGLIYLSFLAYAIFQLLPARMSIAFYDRIAWPFVTLNLLGIAWQLAFTSDMIGISLCIIIGMLILGGILFTLMKREIVQKGYSAWQAVPFSIFFGWISVAAIANLAAWFVYLGWPGNIMNNSVSTLILLGAGFVLALVISHLYDDWLYPLVFVWAYTGIWVADRAFAPIVAYTALIIAVLLAVLIVFRLIKRRA